MKVEDLMVGDWVYITEHPMRKEAKQVKPEHFLRSLVTFEPIPLTPEILEKNGFDRDERITLYCDYIGVDDRVILNNDKAYINSANEWLVYIDSEDYSTIASCELTYVHELQHILRLCKIDKEIVL
jgi:hypothetical protein